ncbi:MAG: hypothetical protein KC636_40195, partial [Myxococcales bacterium]|nr:hypothetical protein [Myxococcales bacterium]
IFRATTAPVVAKVQSKPSGPGSLFITAEGTIQAHLVAAQNQHLIGPLGPLSVRAFNHCVRCFAGFWALRRAIVDNATAMPAKIKLALEATSDPCVAKFVTGKAIGEISNG